MRKTTDRMEPFVGNTRGDDWPKGGYIHPTGMLNRARRREVFRVNSDRRTRKVVKAIRLRRMYGQPWTPGKHR